MEPDFSLSGREYAFASAFFFGQDEFNSPWTYSFPLWTFLERLTQHFNADEHSYCCLDGANITQSVVFPSGFVGRGTFWKLGDWLNIPIFLGIRFCPIERNISEAKIWIGDVQTREQVFPEAEYDTIEAFIDDNKLASLNWRPAFCKKNGVWSKCSIFDISPLLETDKQ